MAAGESDAEAEPRGAEEGDAGADALPLAVGPAAAAEWLNAVAVGEAAAEPEGDASGEWLAAPLALAESVLPPKSHAQPPHAAPPALREAEGEAPPLAVGEGAPLAVATNTLGHATSTGTDEGP